MELSNKVITLLFFLVGGVVQNTPLYALEYAQPSVAAGNPGNVNQEDQEFPVGSLPAGWNTILAASNATPTWSSNQGIPFTFEFNDVTQMSYKVSSTGILTFDTSAGAPPSSIPAALPSASIPDRSAVIWGIEGTGSSDNIVTKVFGTAPNRQLWVFFTSYTIPGDASSWAYLSIVLEETTNAIYFVDQRVANATLSATIGIQVDGTTAYQVAGSPAVANLSGTDPTRADNWHYSFLPDSDGDGVGDIVDNCLSDNNPEQKDMDADGDGNQCDIDTDGDGVPNSYLNTDGEYPVGGGLSPDWFVLLAPFINRAWSLPEIVPFDFLFNDTLTLFLRVSNTGILTFSVISDLPPTATPAELPSSTIPDQSIVVWGIESTGVAENIVTKLFGAAPYRQFWISFNDYSIPAEASAWSYWSIVLEETTNAIYIVDQRNANGTLHATVGIQVDSQTAFQVAGSPNVGHLAGNDPTAADNWYYTFLPGTSPVYSQLPIAQGTPGAIDEDDDNDGVLDVDENDGASKPFNSLDPDRDSDGIIDSLDPDPDTASNSVFCEDENGPYATVSFTQPVFDDTTCAATVKIILEPSALVESGGILRLIAPQVAVNPKATSVFVEEEGEMTIISKDPTALIPPQ